MTKIIDNFKVKLASALVDEFRDKDEVAIASAYFNVQGYREIKEGIKDKPLRLLLGREPTESIKWEEVILKELEEQEDDPEYYKLLQEAINYFKDPDRAVRNPRGHSSTAKPTSQLPQA